MPLIYPAAYIEFSNGNTIEFAKPQQIIFTAADLLPTIEMQLAQLIEFVVAPWNSITPVPSAQILTADGEALTADGDTLTW